MLKLEHIFHMMLACILSAWHESKIVSCIRTPKDFSLSFPFSIRIATSRVVHTFSHRTHYHTHSHKQKIRYMNSIDNEIPKPARFTRRQHFLSFSSACWLSFFISLWRCVFFFLLKFLLFIKCAQWILVAYVFALLQSFFSLEQFVYHLHCWNFLFFLNYFRFILP